MSDTLSKQEFKHLVNKINHNALATDYFRKNLFNATIRKSEDLKRAKTIYQDHNIIIKVDRSLNQRHRDLLSLLAYEEKSKISKDGSYYIKTSAYKLAHTLYPRSRNAIHRVESLLRDLQKTLIDVSQNNKKLTHTILDDSYYDKDIDTYIVKVNANTARYNIYTNCVSIPEKLNLKIVQIADSKAKIKALISFMLSNAKLENGMFFDTICDKLDITGRTVKSKFKKQILDNLELLKEFKIKYEDDKFYLKKEKCTFFHALSDKQIISFEKNEKSKKFDKKLADVMSHKKDTNIIIYKYMQEDDVEIEIKFYDEKLAFFKNDEFIRQLSKDEIRAVIVNMI